MPSYIETELDLPTSEMAPVRRGSPVEVALREHTQMVARSVASMDRCAQIMAKCVADMAAEEVNEKPELEEWEVKLSPPAPDGSKSAKFRRTK